MTLLFIMNLWTLSISQWMRFDACAFFHPSTESLGSCPSFCLSFLLHTFVNETKTPSNSIPGMAVKNMCAHHFCENKILSFCCCFRSQNCRIENDKIIKEEKRGIFVCVSVLVVRFYLYLSLNAYDLHFSFYVVAKRERCRKKINCNGSCAVFAFPSDYVFLLLFWASSLHHSWALTIIMPKKKRILSQKLIKVVRISESWNGCAFFPCSN